MHTTRADSQIVITSMEALTVWLSAHITVVGMGGLSAWLPHITRQLSSGLPKAMHVLVCITVAFITSYTAFQHQTNLSLPIYITVITCLLHKPDQ